MTKLTKPTYIFNKIEEIPVELFKRIGIKGVLLDIDNTIMDYTGLVTASIDRWIKEVKKAGVKICIVSNTFNVNKVKTLMLKYDINGLANAKKPALKGYNMALNLLDLKKSEVIMIGDQVLTDVVGANRFKIKSIYVKPINKKEWIVTRIKRPIESLILKLGK